MKTILAIDPSGNFNEGEGTTGWVLMREDYRVLDGGHISATNYDCAERYWNEHIQLIENTKFDYIIIEGYKLYNHHGMKAEVQAHSELETSQLIGILKYWCFITHYNLTIQYASDVKTRWSNKILTDLGLLTKKGQYYCIGINQLLCNRHERDALRHAVHFNRYILDNKIEKGGNT